MPRAQDTRLGGAAGAAPAYDPGNALDATRSIMWIRTISPGEAAGLLKKSYDAAVRRAGRVFQIVRAMSLTPPVLETSMELYQRIMYGPSPLTRCQREMLAVVVSRANDCHY